MYQKYNANEETLINTSVVQTLLFPESFLKET